MTTTTLAHLERLVAFPSVCTAARYTDIADHAFEHLRSIGFTCHKLPDPTGTRMGILATSHPHLTGGAMLSAHLDVVPVEGQAWSQDPFRLTERGGRLYGRGTCDMKGFAAAALAAADRAATMDLKRPLKIAFSYDEELGCIGLADMIGKVGETIGHPDICVVGEPTRMRVTTGHKGKTSYRVTFRGTAGHSASAPEYLNALHMAADFLAVLRSVQRELQTAGARDPAYGVACSTVHAGVMSGGTALNIVPDTASLEFEIRHLAADRPEDILGRISDAADRLARDCRTRFGQAAIEIAETNAYPGFEASTGNAAVLAVTDAGGISPAGKVDFGTEAGFFQEAGIPTVVCGPGNMEQGHKPDEFIEISQLEACDAMLDALLA